MIITDDQIDSLEEIKIANVKITPKVQEAFDVLAQFFAKHGIHSSYLDIEYHTAQRKITKGTAPFTYPDIIFYNKYSLECFGLKVKNGIKEKVELTIKSKNVRAD